MLHTHTQTHNEREFVVKYNFSTLIIKISDNKPRVVFNLKIAKKKKTFNDNFW
jgi:hypothetical protein